MSSFTTDVWIVWSKALVGSAVNAFNYPKVTRRWISSPYISTKNIFYTVVGVRYHNHNHSDIFGTGIIASVHLLVQGLYLGPERPELWCPSGVNERFRNEAPQKMMDSNFKLYTVYRTPVFWLDI